MSILQWWSTTNLNPVGMHLQRAGHYLFGVAVGLCLAQYFPAATLHFAALAILVSFVFFWLAQYQVKATNEKGSN